MAFWGVGNWPVTFLCVIYLCYYLVLLFGPNEKQTCVHIAKGVKNVIFILFQIKGTFFFFCLSKMMT